MAEKLSREEMIEDIVSEVDDWELDILIAYSKECLRNALNDMVPEELEKEWKYKYGE